MKQGLIALMMLAGFALLLAACGGSGSAPNPGGGGPTVACTVDAPSTAGYAPSSCTVKVGQAVKFTGIAGHPLLPTGVNPDNPIPNTAGTGKDTETVIFGKAGTYGFVCAFHPGMTGSITVVP